MLEVRKYSIAELSAILGSTGKQAIDRKLERYGVEYTSTGRGQSLVYDITKITDPFKVYCITKLGIPAQANFEKIRNLYYYFFCDEGFADLPLIEMAEYLEAEGVPQSRQCVTKWIEYLRHLDYIGFTNTDCKYYAIEKTPSKVKICHEITREEYCQAWAIYHRNKIEHGSYYAYALMYNTLGGHPYKKPIYYQNVIMAQEIQELIDIILDTLPTPD